MTDFSSLTDEQLNRMDKHGLITIIKGLQLQLNTITSQLDFLTEQIALMNQRSFGRKTEQADQMHSSHSLKSSTKQNSSPMILKIRRSLRSWFLPIPGSQSLSAKRISKVFLSAFMLVSNTPESWFLDARIFSRKNWGNVNSIRGAETSAIMYSLMETAKANGLRVYDYLEYVLTELAAHQDGTNRAFLADLLPWSKVVQKKCRTVKKK